MDDEISEIRNSSVTFVPPVPHCRKSIRLEASAEGPYLYNYSQRLHMQHKFTMRQNEMSRRRKNSINSSKNEASFSDNNIDHDGEMTENSDEYSSEMEEFALSQNRSRTISPEKINISSKEKPQSRKRFQSSSIEQTTDRSSYLPISIIVIILVILFVFNIRKEKQTQSVNYANSLFKSIEDVKTRFCNQESDTWNDISSAINEVITRTPKTPSIILLFANETTTMDCLAAELAHVSCTLLGSNIPLCLNPNDFGDDPGEIINSLNKSIPTKKVVIIRDVLNIKAGAIKALHNLCDRINPLVEEAIYIITMQTKNYELSQKKLAFVEEQIYHKLSKNIDEDILMALIVRITDGAIIPVQPEPNPLLMFEFAKRRNILKCIQY